MKHDGQHDVPAHTLAARLAAQIIERTRQTGMRAGSHLIEQDLADAFRVSRTPIRLALKILQDMKLVENRPNRGFFLLQQPGKAHLEGGLPPAAEGADEDPLYFQIAEDRLNGALGARCTEAELARRYGASRARILRLLSRMAQEGWVERLPGHGWSFQSLLCSRHAQVQGNRYRMLIEPAALLEPGFRLPPETLAEMRSQQLAILDGGCERWSRSERFGANASFHETLVGAADNPFLLEGVRRVNRLRRLLDYRTQLERADLVAECEEHLALLALIEAEDNEAAAALMVEHLRTAPDHEIAQGECALPA